MINQNHTWFHTDVSTILTLCPASNVAIPGRDRNMANVIGRHNILRPRQNGRYSSYDACKCIFLNENIWIAIKISPKCVPKDPVYSILALDQIMAWRRPGAYMRHSVSYSKSRNSARWRNTLRDNVCKSTRGHMSMTQCCTTPPPPPPLLPHKQMHILYQLLLWYCSIHIDFWSQFRPRDNHLFLTQGVKLYLIIVYRFL